MKTLQITFWRWLPFAVLATIMAGLVYISVQQTMRHAANDPQIELAEDAALLLSRGQPPEIFGTNASVDFRRSLSPFIIVYDQQAKVLTGTASLNGKIPTPPQGVFDHAKENGENRITWKPAPGIRIATVVKYYNGSSTGYVLAGRSLREVDNRIENLMLYVFIGWAAALMCTYILCMFIPSDREVANGTV